MRPIHSARVGGKTRPVLILTRSAVRDYRTLVTIAPITSTARGLLSEVAVGPENGIGHDSVVNCDNIATIPSTDLGRQIGNFHPDQEADLSAAIRAAFDLD